MHYICIAVFVLGYNCMAHLLSPITPQREMTFVNVTCSNTVPSYVLSDFSSVQCIGNSIFEIMHFLDPITPRTGMIGMSLVTTLNYIKNFISIYGLC